MLPEFKLFLKGEHVGFLIYREEKHWALKGLAIYSYCIKPDGTPASLAIMWDPLE